MLECERKEVRHRDPPACNQRFRYTKNIPYLKCGLFLWLLIFWTQPHKEERFLFPVYPLIALAGALAIDSMQRLIQVESQKDWIA